MAVAYSGQDAGSEDRKITAVGAKTAYITPGSPWENGYVESKRSI
jgi:putative transposase